MDRAIMLNRRRFLGLAAGAVALGAAGWSLAKPALLNPCRAAMTPDLAASPWLHQVWQGLDPQQVWDCHVHLAGVGDSDSGVVIGPQLDSCLHPVQYGQRLLYMNAGCVEQGQGIDHSYAARLFNLAAAMPAGCKLLLFAFDRYHDAQGRPQDDESSLYVPNEYAARLAATHAERFEWVASIHPHRADAVEALQAAHAAGARAVKWLPSAMGIDPASPRCDAFYRALHQMDLPLIAHAGKEQAVKGENRQSLNNPLRLRRALAAGVRVVVAHCASMGQDVDLDRGAHGPAIDNFALFARMMDEPQNRGLLFGDVSAIMLRNRSLEVLTTLLGRTDWHERLLNGSDYPIPGILPLIAPAALARAGLLPRAAVGDLERLREHNPLLFDLALKRLAVWRGHRFAASVFHTRSFFLQHAKVLS